MVSQIDEAAANSGNAPGLSDPPLATHKYSVYRNEVATRLAGKLSPRERRRLEAQQVLLERARFVELRGVVHHYIDAGPLTGEPLLLVHSWNCSAYWWHHVIDPLAAAGYRVICYDQRGHGFSDNDPHGAYTLADFGADLHALANALQLSAQHVAAFSHGALTALHYADAAPERVRSLTLFNFGLKPYSRANAALSPRLSDTLFNRVLRPIERRGLWWLPYLYALAMLTKNSVSVSDIKLATLGLRCCDPRAVGAAARESAQRSVLAAVPEQLRRVSQPALLVAGANDPLMRPGSGRKLMQLAPQGQFLEVPRCGHLMLFELPDQVTQIMRLFLRGARG